MSAVDWEFGSAESLLSFVSKRPGGIAMRRVPLKAERGVWRSPLWLALLIKGCLCVWCCRSSKASGSRASIMLLWSSSWSFLPGVSWPCRCSPWVTVILSYVTFVVHVYQDTCFNYRCTILFLPKFTPEGGNIRLKTTIQSRVETQEHFHKRLKLKWKLKIWKWKLNINK